VLEGAVVALTADSELLNPRDGLPVAGDNVIMTEVEVDLYGAMTFDFI
jgi:hypothetical protein